MITGTTRRRVAPAPRLWSPRPRRPGRRRLRPVSLAAGDVPLRAPMPGMIISYKVKVGDKVNTGDMVCVLEAMKMQNSLTAPATGAVTAINFEPAPPWPKTPPSW